jgi:hypothetical protein
MTDRRSNGTWAPGHGPALGRGIRNRLAKEVFQDTLAHWCEIEQTSGRRKGEIALELLFREKPNEYCRLVASVLPKQFEVSAAELNLPDEELDELILSLRRRMEEQRALERREAVPMLPVKQVAS